MNVITETHYIFDYAAFLAYLIFKDSKLWEIIDIPEELKTGRLRWEFRILYMS